MTLPAIAQSALVAEGIALHDAGKYDEAIVKFKAALEASPQDDLASYELGLTYFAKRDYAACITTMQAGAARKGRYQPAFLAILGNCLDESGDREGAIRAYRRGLKTAPEDTQLLYNLAVSLIGKGERQEAKKLLKKELAIEPNHGSGHFALATMFLEEKFRGPALLQYLRFLAVEPTGPRAKVAAERVVALLGAGISMQEGGDVTITIDPNPRKEEGDFSGWEMTLGIVGAAQNLPENAQLNEFEKRRKNVVSALQILVELEPKGRSFVHKETVPFFSAAAKEDLLETLGGIAIVSLELKGTQQWLEAHKADLTKFGLFLESRSKR
ncbi:MAG TPA: tetratricopeptide repeat protein [Thermoanaerobaculia bacterium]|nr:tetratricopeptide repeat protein [Thermoanaerobaculia bacterium]